MADEVIVEGLDYCDFVALKNILKSRTSFSVEQAVEIEEAKILLDPVFFRRSLENLHKLKNSSKGKCGLNIICYEDLNHGSTGVFDETKYLSCLIRLIITISKQSKIGLYTNGSKKDFLYAEKLMTKLPTNENIYLCDRPEQTRDLECLVSSFELNLCFRMHAAILAASLGCDFIIFCWDEKIDEVFDSAGLSHHVVGLKELNNDFNFSEMIKKASLRQAKFDTQNSLKILLKEINVYKQRLN